MARRKAAENISWLVYKTLFMFQQLMIHAIWFT